MYCKTHWQWKYLLRRHLRTSAEQATWHILQTQLLRLSMDLVAYDIQFIVCSHPRCRYERISACRAEGRIGHCWKQHPSWAEDFVCSVLIIPNKEGSGEARARHTCAWQWRPRDMNHTLTSMWSRQAVVLAVKAKCPTTTTLGDFWWRLGMHKWHLGLHSAALPFLPAMILASRLALTCRDCI